MKRTYRTKDETIRYFEILSNEYEKEAHRNGDNPVLLAKAEAYEMAAYELKNNTK